MTREEAIERLNIHKSTSVFVDSIAEAIDMAIEALNEADKREQYGQNYEADDFVKLGVTDKNKDKVILYDAFGEKEYYPQTDLVRCKDCKHWQMTNIETMDGEPVYDCPFCGEWADANGFCSFGERREE